MISVRPALFVSFAALGLLLGGCATPGPLHVYTLESGVPQAVRDKGESNTLDVSTFMEEGDSVLGFAYDPFTDHFFLRLAPGNHIRVIDRPARAIKREYTVTTLSDKNEVADLALRPRSGHVYAVLPHETALAEFTRLGEPVRKLVLSGLTSSPVGVAFDTVRDQLIVLTSAPATITRFSLEGNPLGSTLALAGEIGAPSLAYDSEREEYYLPLVGDKAVGIYGADGKLVRTLPLAAPFVDLGPRSLIRMF